MAPNSNSDKVLENSFSQDACSQDSVTQAIAKPLSKSLPNSLAISAAAVLALTGIATYGVYRASNGAIADEPELIEPETQAIATVSALGYLHPEGDIVNLSAPAAANGTSDRLARLLVEAGDQIKAGDLVAVLESAASLSAAVAQAEEQVEMALAELEQIEAGAKAGAVAAQSAEVTATTAELVGQLDMQKSKLTRLTTEAKTAKAEYDRYQRLFEQGAIAEADLDQKRLNMVAFQEELDEARANRNRMQAVMQAEVESAAASLDEVREVRPTDRRIAQAKVQSARANLEKAQVDLEMTYIRAPTDGQVLEIYTRPGEAIGAQGILTLGQTHKMNAIAEVYELDIDRVRLGQLATVESAALREDLTGEVVQIGAQINPQNINSTDPVTDVDKRVVAVKVRLDAEDAQKVSSLTNLQVTVAIDASEVAQ